MGPENSDGFEGLVRLRGLLLHRHFYGGLEGFHWENGQGIGRPGEKARGKGKRIQTLYERFGRSVLKKKQYTSTFINFVPNLLVSAILV